MRRLSRKAGKRGFANISRLVAVAGLIALSHLCAYGEREPEAQAPVSAIFISDLHFDPFADPGKTARLAASPAAGWKKIFDSPPSADKDATAARVRERCGSDLYDASPNLLDSFSAAVTTQRKTASFAVVTGDLLVHDFFCRYEAALPGHTHEEAQAFAARTVQYVIESLRRAAAPRPVYIALGNNDSDCNDYRLDPNDRLLQQALPGIARAAHLSPAMLKQQGFAAAGRYSAMLPLPMRNTRIVVLDDVPASARYATCAGKKDTRLAEENLQWLRQQLQSAREAGQSVWFAAHIPPGVYARNTLFKADMCTSRTPTMFLASDALTATLTEYADVVKLALFGHTHMDELRLLGGAVPAKLIPAVSPISGNRPAFLVAQVDTRTATMLDYTEYAAPASDARKDKWAGPWEATYSFRQTYRALEFSAPALKGLLDRFATEPMEGSTASASYVKWYGGGAAEYGVGPVWKNYQCLLKNTTQAGFLDCACPADPVVKERP